MLEGSYYAVIVVNDTEEELTTHVDFSVTSPPVAGDIDSDGKVTIKDLGLLRKSINQCSGNKRYNERADLDESGCVNHRDIQLWFEIYHQQRHWKNWLIWFFRQWFVQ
ncbi:dockerin type I domain-containing protein [Aliikangiella maris]|uniref:dockerin type I domain-containing protein n=1 Tax=Aliikangiella maris TaxID=3162458 RepID=UPI003395D414